MWFAMPTPSPHFPPGIPVQPLFPYLLGALVLFVGLFYFAHLLHNKDHFLIERNLVLRRVLTT